MKNKKIDEIWQAFEKAIEKRFLPDGKLPHYPAKDAATASEATTLSYALSRLWRAAMYPTNAFLGVIPELEFPGFFEISNQEMDYSNGRQGISLSLRLPDVPYFSIQLTAGTHGVAAWVFCGDFALWQTSIRYSRDGLHGQPLAFDVLVKQVYEQALDIVINSDTDIKANIAKQEAA
ncbi:MAG: hypothetical protein CR975_05635 [Gammaproteobacteria bacterium]|nr:MAG: hypothetical protein CR975_05635 [Gammaproteobacteria bacterium]